MIGEGNQLFGLDPRARVQAAASSFVPAMDLPAPAETDTDDRKRSGGLCLSHVLVPLDGSALAEGIIPYVIALAETFSPRITLLRVLQPPAAGPCQHVDPVGWEIIRTEAHRYLAALQERLEPANIRASAEVCEGNAAEQVILFAARNAVDLIALSTHGESGLSGWTLSSTIQKVVARTHTSVFVVPAYAIQEPSPGSPRFEKILLPLDCSPRAECTLAVACALARKHDGTLILAHVVPEPEVPRRMPLCEEDQALAAQLTERNREAAQSYLNDLQRRLAAEGARVEVRLVVSQRRARSIRALAEREKVDLVLISAHGQTGDPNDRYGAVAARLVQQCPTPMLVVQDLPREAHALSIAEEAARTRPGH